MPRLFAETDEVEAALAPYRGEALTAEGWQRFYDAETDRLSSLVRKHKWLRWLPGGLRGQKAVKQNYSSQWEQFRAEQQVEPEGKRIPMEWRGQHFMGRAVGTKRVHQLYLMRLIEDMAPQSVLEVGAGNGLNLVELAARFPQLRLTGLELTPGGVEASVRLANTVPLPRPILDFSPLPPVRDNVAGVIDFRVGDASRMPFAAQSFDLVFTSLALEQMEEVRDAALREIARVARNWVVMIEPFRDFNDSGVRELYIRANRYFSARIEELTKYGLKPVQVIDDIPHKLAMKAAVVVAKKE